MAMEPVERHPYPADVSFDGGDLDCGNGLLLLIRQHLDPLVPGQLLEFRSTEISVEEDFPAWCRLTGNELVSFTKTGRQRSFLVCKGPLSGRPSAATARPAPPASVLARTGIPVIIPATLPSPAPAAAIRPLAVMGIGSWPRPRWMLAAMHEHVEGRLARRRVRGHGRRRRTPGRRRAAPRRRRRGHRRRAAPRQLRELRGRPARQLPAHPADRSAAARRRPREVRAPSCSSLDVPASEVRHPAVFGPLGRSRPLGRARARVRAHADRPAGEGRAARAVSAHAGSMWIECISDRVYRSREHLAEDIVRVLREEMHHLLAAGVALVQLDEPVLSEVVFTGSKNTRSFMCGALSEKGERQARAGLRPGAARRRRRPGCRASGSACTSAAATGRATSGAALAGDYRPLLPLLAAARRRHALPRALHAARRRARRAGRPAARRAASAWASSIRSTTRVETVDEIVARARRAVDALRRRARAPHARLRLRHLRRQPDRVSRASPRRSCARWWLRRRSSAAGERQAARQRARSIPYTRAGWPNSSVWPRSVSPSRSATRIDGSLPGRMRLMRWSRPSSVNA